MPPHPQEPVEQPLKPPPIWTPDPAIEEPEPERMPDEAPLPNPDENIDPPIYVPPPGKLASVRWH